MRWHAKYITFYTGKPAYRYVDAYDVNEATRQAERYAGKGELKGYRLEVVTPVI